MRIEKLIPACKDYLWGGNKLKEKYGKSTFLSPCAESWELSYHKDGLTTLVDGRTLAEALSIEELGDNVKGFDAFPMLIKFIDACNNLSIQVHPSNEYALKNENSLGKVEMWYVVEAEEGAGVYVGFKNEITREEYETAIRENTLTELLNFYEVKKGETYFIPSGTVHAIAKGCLICEIQQNSNLTYRVYDYGRVDKNGNPRELHVDLALRVSTLGAYIPRAIHAFTEEGELLAISKYFTVSRLTVSSPTTIKCDKGSFRCVTCVEGEGSLECKAIRSGDSYLISACNECVVLEGNMTLLLSSVRKYYVGIDLIGTFIKGEIVDDLGHLIVSDKVSAKKKRGERAVAENIAAFVNRLLQKNNLSPCDLEGISIGVPRMIDSKASEAIYSSNLERKNSKLIKMLGELIEIPARIANDTNVSALEYIIKETSPTEQ